jgi:hypothetical protein
MDNMNTMPMGKTCQCSHHKVVPLLVILFALDFFLGTLGVLSAQFVSLSWPILVAIAGFMKMSKCKCC